MRIEKSRNQEGFDVVDDVFVPDELEESEEDEELDEPDEEEPPLDPLSEDPEDPPELPCGLLLEEAYKSEYQPPPLRMNPVPREICRRAVS